MIRERKLTILCPKTKEEFTVSFDLDWVCGKTLHLVCPEYYPEIHSPTKEKGEVYINFTPMSEKEMKANSLHVTGILEHGYEGNVLIEIDCKRCGLKYKRLFEA